MNTAAVVQKSDHAIVRGAARRGARVTKLSVNLNKVALLRNARRTGVPEVVQAARICIAAAAHGLTLHPRPDERHAKPSDVETVAELLRSESTIELNVKGNPFHTLLPIVRRAVDQQVRARSTQ
jgi:pyridoxine 5-phosphate synthase